MLVNKKAVKMFTLGVAQASRGDKFTRVSKEFVERVDFAMREYIRKQVHAHPTIGKTIK